MSSKCSASFEYIVSNNMNNRVKKSGGRRTRFSEWKAQVFSFLVHCRIAYFLILCECEARLSDTAASTHQMFANYIVASIFFACTILCHIVFFYSKFCCLYPTAVNFSYVQRHEDILLCPPCHTLHPDIIKTESYFLRSKPDNGTYFGTLYVYYCFHKMYSHNCQRTARALWRTGALNGI